MSRIRRIAVTGASGMVGRHVLQFAEKEGISCVASSRIKPHNLPENSIWHSWDLCRWLEMDELDTLFGDVDALLHVGALTPRKDTPSGSRDTFDANVRSCLGLGMWALKREIPVVYLSTSTGYADSESPKKKEDSSLSHHSGNLGGFYGFSKLLGEEVFTRLGTEGLNVCILRPSSIYGVGMPDDQMIPIFMNSALKDEDIIITVHPDSRVNLIHAMDVASAMFAVLKLETFKVYNIASPVQNSISSVAETVIRTCEGSQSDIIQKYDISSTPFNRFDLDCSAAYKDFNFSPHINLEKGLNIMKEDMGKYGFK